MNSNGEEQGSRSHRTEIIVALIALVGTLGSALFANWDKVFPPNKHDQPSISTPSSPLPTPSTTLPTSSSDLPRPNIMLEGIEEYEANERQWKRYGSAFL